ncbi:SDR family NAD(P)-dependent oxidoreductase [uncultured Williamsia sp.]|uniref:SDR family NAD(P)-dependent oxidoreductase n=1 Tax=uncultured Williamsia sp. TaxID=259311 RepID=UPI00261110CD|nr:SDR family NAD(P)-dependent oxidoreductase [uncultured Williamsia sp.]
MASIFITGSTDGLGLMAAQRLIADGHHVTLHARSATRAEETRQTVPDARDIVVGDVSQTGGMKSVAEQATDAGPFDAVIHNVGLGYRASERIETPDGLSRTFAVNVLAPYVLTASMPWSERLIYLSSVLHQNGVADLSDPQWTRRPWDGNQAYADSKLFDLMLAFAVARRRPDAFVNSVEPGWVPTKLGGDEATDDLEAGPVTQAWLATSDDPEALVTGQHFYHQQVAATHPDAHSIEKQEDLLDYCAQLTGIRLD